MVKSPWKSEVKPPSVVNRYFECAGAGQSIEILSSGGGEALVGKATLPVAAWKLSILAGECSAAIPCSPRTSGDGTYCAAAAPPFWQHFSCQLGKAWEHGACIGIGGISHAPVRDESGDDNT